MKKMKIIKPAVCGTLESSDVQITVRPNKGKGIEVEINSIVRLVFGDAILETVHQVLNEFQIRDAYVTLIDKGALDCVIRSRLQAVLLRAAEEKYDWTREDK